MRLAEDRGLVQILSALAATGDVAYVWDLASGALEWHGSPGMLGLTDAAAVANARGFADRIDPDDFLLRQRRLEAHLDIGSVFDVEYRIRREDGGVAWLHERGSAERDEFGRPQRMLGVIRAVDESAVPPPARPDGYSEAIGQHQRTRLRRALDRILMQSLCSGVPGAYLAVGVDELARFAAPGGAAVAEEVAAAIGRRLNNLLRPGDEFGRVAADRFGIVVADCSEEQISVIAGKILDTVCESPVETGVGPVSATVSIGGVIFPSQAPTASGVMTHAGIALAEARCAGQDRFSLYRPTDEQRRRRSMALELGERVQRAQREGSLTFAYQPVVDSATGAVDYYECLLRMIGQDGSIVIAGSFVEAIEHLGFIRLIDRYALEMTVREVEQHPGIRLGLNISGLTATDPSWLRAAKALLAGKPAIAERLVVEITETAALHDLDESAHCVRRLKEFGCRVAFDDFGVGFTSLRHLHALDIDMLKIDGSVIRDLVHDRGSQAFLRHLVALAKRLGVRAVAEYVETEEQAKILRQEGVDFLQGYYFGAPRLEKPWLLPPEAAGAPRLLVSGTRR